jgi:hypothetical protein
LPAENFGALIIRKQENRSMNHGSANGARAALIAQTRIQTLI